MICSERTLKNLIGRGALFTKLDINLLVCPEKVFNRVSDPGELGLDKEKFPFKIWRDHVQGQETAGTGKKKSKIYKPSVGEIIYVADENAVNRGRITWSTQKSNKGDQGHYAYFLNFVTDNQLLVQLSGQSRPVIMVGLFDPRGFRCRKSGRTSEGSPSAIRR